MCNEVVKSVFALSFVCQIIKRECAVVFQGASSLSLDAKGRLSVPTRHRDVLSATASGQLTITKHPHGCLMVFHVPSGKNSANASLPCRCRPSGGKGFFWAMPW